MSAIPVHVDIVINDVRPFERVGVVVVVEVDEVIPFIETHDDAVLQARGIHQDLVLRNVLILGDALDEAHEQLGLGYPITHLEVLFGLHAYQYQREDEGAHSHVPPPGPYPVA